MEVFKAVSALARSHSDPLLRSSVSDNVPRAGGILGLLHNN